VAVRPDEPDGVAGVAWFLLRGTFGCGGYLKLLAVLPGSAGRGAGSALLAAFECALIGQQRAAFLLVSDFNTAAQAFYRSRGYLQCGTLPSLVLPDVTELILWKRL
jgi:ribosomal protein S18 acetylase RimI-like enzyme